MGPTAFASGGQPYCEHGRRSLQDRESKAGLESSDLEMSRRQFCQPRL